MSCHNPEKRKGGLDMTTREAVLRGGEGGPAVVEGKPEESRLIGLLAPDADPHMPPKKQLSEAHIALLAEWVRDGMAWDDGGGAGGGMSLRPVALGALPAEYRPVMAMALSPDGRRLAAGCGSELTVFEVEGDLLVLKARAKAHLDAVQSIAWTPDGRRLVTGAFRRILVWDAATLSPEREIISGLTDRITALQALADGTQAIAADGLTGEQGVVRVLDWATGAIVRSWTAHSDTIFALASRQNGGNVATAGGDGFVKVWELASGREVARFEGHATQVLGLAFNGDGSQLVTAGADRQLKVWDVATRENIVALANKPAAINAVAWGAEGAVVAVTDEGAAYRYTDLKAHSGAQSSETGNERRLGGVDVPLLCVVVAPDGGRLFAGTSDGRVVGWTADGKAFEPVDIESATVPAAAASVTKDPDPQ
ncbi:MAG: c-type cytochrome domain-containing protein [Verrucomicrobiales bacterium]